MQLATHPGTVLPKTPCVILCHVLYSVKLAPGGGKSSVFFQKDVWFTKVPPAPEIFNSEKFVAKPQAEI